MRSFLGFKASMAFFHEVFFLFSFSSVSTLKMKKNNTPIEVNMPPNMNVRLKPSLSAIRPEREGTIALAMKKGVMVSPNAPPICFSVTDSAVIAPLAGCSAMNEKFIKVYATIRRGYVLV